jgi:cytidine deaminase
MATVADPIDWKKLRDKATDAAQGAYAEYSNFKVGAAALVDNGRIITGCNVENVSYGLTLCAECAVVCALYSRDGGRGGTLRALTCVDGKGQLLMPCGRCRQLLFEHGGAEILVDHPDGPKRLGDLLPDAFGRKDIAAYKQDSR